MSMQQNRNEEKEVKEAIAKVREVVRRASKDDIVLALYHHDFDIDRTIQAFCDGGAQRAVGSWEKYKKKNQRKNKLAKDQTVTATTVPAPSCTYGSYSASRTLNGVVPSPNINEKANSVSHSETVQLLASKSENLVSTADSAKMPSASSMPFKSAIPSEIRNPDNDCLGEDAAGLRDHEKQIEKMESVFENQITMAGENVRNSFKSIRQILIERENHLLAELQRTHDEGARFFNERRLQSYELYDRSKRMSAMSDREREELHDEITRFNAEKQNEEGVALADRFHCDNAQLIKLVKNFGEVVAVNSTVGSETNLAARQPGTTASAFVMKHSTSHSSLVSSLGEDSGLGQISPVGNEDRKNVAEISNGGILMKSDALTAEQLADLNKKLQESLKAQGIDTSILSGIGCRNGMPSRRRLPASGRGGQSNLTRGGKSTSARGGRGTTQSSSSGKTSLVRVPGLFILES